MWDGTRCYINIMACQEGANVPCRWRSLVRCFIMFLNRKKYLRQGEMFWFQCSFTTIMQHLTPCLSYWHQQPKTKSQLNGTARTWPQVSLDLQWQSSQHFATVGLPTLYERSSRCNFRIGQAFGCFVFLTRQLMVRRADFTIELRLNSHALYSYSE